MPARTLPGLIAKARVEVEIAERRGRDPSTFSFIREVAAFAAPVPSLADARLIALADAYEATEAACNAHTAAHRGRGDATSEDGFDALCDGFAPIEQEIAETPADTMAGVLAKARAAQVPTARAFDTCPFAMSIADDLWRLLGRPAAVETVDPVAVASAA